MNKVIIVEIARPKTRLPIVNNPTIYLKDKGLLAAVNYSGTGKDANLFLIDIEKMKDKKYKLPEGERGAYGFVRGTDGKLYLGTFSGRIYSFDIDKEELKEIVHPFTDGQMVWGGGASSLGKIYMGVCPTGEFCEYDIKTGSWEIFKPMPEENLGFYARGFIELPDKRMLIFIWGAKPTLLIYDPEKKDYQRVFSWNSEEAVHFPLESFLDEERLIVSSKKGLQLFNWKKLKFEDYFLGKNPEELRVIVKVKNEFYGIGASSGKIYEIKNKEIKIVKENFPYGNKFSRIHHLKEDEFIGLGDNGLFVKFNLKTDKISSFQIQNESNNGMPLNMLKKIPGKDLVVGSHFINMQIFKINLKNKKCTSSLNKISGYGGQINCGTYLNNIFYLASYIRAVLYAFDPEKSFEYMKNPRVIAEIGKQQNRPVTMVNDGRYVYITTKSNYGTLGGAISVFDPETEEIEVYRNFVQDQNPNSLFYHQDTEYLVGTTGIYGDCKTHQAKAKYAVVYIWDTKKRKTVHTSFPWEADGIGACDLSTEGKLIGFKDTQYFIFDISTKKYEIRKWKEKGVAGGLFMGNRYFYGATEDNLFQLDIKTDKVSLLEKTSGTTLFEKISEKEFIFNQELTIIKKALIA